MIVSFKCRKTEQLFLRNSVAPQWRNFAEVALRKLAYLHAAKKVEDLRIPPANRLEKLRGDRAETYSIRINDKWRLCFVFEGGNASEVEILDYH